MTWRDAREGSLLAAIQTAETRGCSLSTFFLEQEAVERACAPEDVLRILETRLAVMGHSFRRGVDTPQHSRSGLIQGGAHRLAQWGGGGNHLLSPAFTRLAAAALAVGEVNACMGRIVAAPTAGSCGVLPAALFVCAESRDWSRGALARALATAGGIGLAIERFASLSGAQGGCQAEVGSASAMASGALVELAGGTPTQSGHAVALALSNLLGLICDPVQGLVEVPCVSRNAMGAANAVLAAEMALAGITSPFGPDEVIETMGRVGRSLPEDHRETGRGGLAALLP